MDNRTAGITARHSRGITLIEILMVLGLVAILLSFAVPSVSGAAARAEMKAAVENIHYTLEIARKSARRGESVIDMSILSEGPSEARFIRLSSRDGNGVSQPIMPGYNVPHGIELKSDHGSYRFDERGLVENPGRIVLVARADESITSTIDIE